MKPVKGVKKSVKSITKKTKVAVAKSTAVAPEVTIEARIDVGFGNALFLRGEGAGLSWERGTPLTCVNGSTWRWSRAGADALKFKLLLNDTVWAQGEDVTAAPGQTLQIAPSF
jgi:hypothetical protein